MDNLHGQDSTSSSSSFAQPKEGTSKDKHCSICQEKATKTCSACKSVYYCSVEHQKVDWKNHKKVCQPYSIEKISEEMGMGWVATRDLKPGFIVMDQVAFFQAPYWPRNGSCRLRRCVTCGDSTSWKSCSKCSWPVCKEECEKNPVHLENECKEFTSRKLKYPPRSKWPVGMLLVGMRANAMKNRDPRKFEQLMANKYTFSPEELKLEHKVTIPQSMVGLFSGQNALNHEELEKLWRICLEDLIIPQVLAESINCVFLEVDQQNHSCFPNCEDAQSPIDRQRIRITIPVNNGEQLTNSYADTDDFAFQSTAYRQRHTRNAGFICKCKRCLDPTELGMFISGIKCFNCSSLLKADSDSDADKIGFLVPADPLDIDSQDPVFECHRCHVKAPFSKVMASLPKVVQTTFREIEPLNDPVSLIFAFAQFKTILEKIEGSQDFKDHLHRNHWIIQLTVRVVTKGQVNDLERMTVRELNKLVRRLELVSNLDETLYPSLFFKHRYENLKRLNNAATLFLTKFGQGMSQAKREKLKKMAEKAEKEQLEYLSNEPYC